MSVTGISACLPDNEIIPGGKLDSLKNPQIRSLAEQTAAKWALSHKLNITDEFPLAD
jgi:hypothetical protein